MEKFQQELDSDPSEREILPATSFEQRCSFFRKNRERKSWGQIIRHQILVQSDKKFNESEIEMLVKFMESMEPKIVDWLKWMGGYRHKFKHRSKTWSRRNAEEEDAYRIACHEAGHVVSHWFAGCTNQVDRVTIIREKNIAGRVFYISSGSLLAYTNDNFFSDMCCCMGGILGESLIAHNTISSIRYTADYDFAVLLLSSYGMAKLSMEETGETDPEELMAFFIRKSYVVTHDLLEKHRKDLKVLSYALFAEKSLDHWDVQDIIGPRPQMDTSLYEEFVKDKISSGQFKENKQFDAKIIPRVSQSERRSSRQELDPSQESEASHL